VSKHPELYTPPAGAALNVTRDDAVVKAWADAAAEMRRLEIHAWTIFSSYHAAQERAAAEGFVCDVGVSPGLAAYYSTYKQALARNRGREVEHEDQTVEGWPIK
jgi:hypothetical protein